MPQVRDNACQETLLIDSEREDKLWKKLVLSLPVQIVLWNQLFFLCSRFRDLFSPTMFRLCSLFFWLLLGPSLASSLVSYVKLLCSCQGIQRWILPKCIQKAIQSTVRSLEMHYKKKAFFSVSIEQQTHFYNDWRLIISVWTRYIPSCSVFLLPWGSRR